MYIVLESCIIICCIGVIILNVFLGRRPSVKILPTQYEKVKCSVVYPSFWITYDFLCRTGIDDSHLVGFRFRSATSLAIRLPDTRSSSTNLSDCRRKPRSSSDSIWTRANWGYQICQWKTVFIFGTLCSSLIKWEFGIIWSCAVILWFTIITRRLIPLDSKRDWSWSCNALYRLEL